MIKFRISGAREMERVLKQLGPIIARRAGQKATMAAAKVIAAEARRLVPVRTGELKNAIIVLPVKSREEREVHTIVGFQRPTAARAHLTEFGTAHSAASPFLRPALDSKVQQALDAMGRELARGIEREAKKLAKPAKRGRL